LAAERPRPNCSVAAAVVAAGGHVGIARDADEALMTMHELAADP
jgi:hypothetical protein